jgi:hypothetical protein
VRMSSALLTFKISRFECQFYCSLLHSKASFIFSGITKNTLRDLIFKLIGILVPLLQNFKAPTPGNFIITNFYHFILSSGGGSIHTFPVILFSVRCVLKRLSDKQR